MARVQIQFKTNVQPIFEPLSDIFSKLPIVRKFTCKKANLKLSHDWLIVHEMSSFLLLGVQLKFEVFISKVYDLPTQREGRLNKQSCTTWFANFLNTKGEAEFYSIHSALVIHHHAFQPLDGTICDMYFDI